MINFSSRFKLPVTLQTETAECGLACISMIASFHGFQVDLRYLRSMFSFSLRGATLKDLADIGERIGLNCRPAKVTLEDLRFISTPCILHWNLNHFVVLKTVNCSFDGKIASVIIHDPAQGKKSLSVNQLSSSFTGIAMELAPGIDFEIKKETSKISIFNLVRKTTGLGASIIRLGFIAIILEFFTLISPLFIQMAIDGPVASSDKGSLRSLAVGFILLIIFQVIMSIYRSWTILFINTNLNLQWTLNIFKHLMQLPFSYFENRHLGDIISRFNSINTIQEILSSKVMEIFLDGFLALVALSILVSYNSILTLVILTCLFLYIFLRTIFFNFSKTITDSALVSRAAEQSIFLESIRGIQAIKLFNHEHDRVSRWSNAYSSYVNKNIIGQKIILSFNSATFLLKGIENAVVIWLGSELVINEGMTIGMLYAFLGYKSLFSDRAYSFVDKVQEIRMISLHVERLSDIVLTKKENAQYATVSKIGKNLPLEIRRIELRNVSFRYSDADPWILKNLNLSIEVGQSIALTGASGCGKTTLLKLLIGVHYPSSGEILINGTSITAIEPSRYRESIAVVMQDDQLFAGSILDNISMFSGAPDLNRIDLCTKDASIFHEIHQFPMGIQTLIGDMGSSLSGGQKQRLLLARALYKRPQILFLDEATSHLDNVNEKQVNTAIKKLAITKIIVAHRPNTIESAERIIELSGGEIISDRMSIGSVDSIVNP